MTKIKKLSKKTLAVILSVMVVMVSLPLMLIPILAADSNDPRVVDPSTHNSWQQLFPADNTTQSGRIWTDKSVFKNGNAFTGLVDAAGNNFNLSMLDKDNNFLVALSALASNKSILGYSYTPTDTMLVLDISASMSNSGYVDELVTSANNAISRLLNLNKHNRVGVILYSDSANGTVLLPIDRYTAPTSGANSGKFINNYGQNYIQVVNGVRNGDKDLMDDDWVSVEGGTYLQSGIYTAMSEFLKQTETVIPDGEHQAGTARTPIFVVMSDGRVTYGTNNFAAQNNSNYQTGLRGSNIGNGTTNQRDETFVAMDFVSQLTAAYAKYKVDEHYNGAEPLFYMPSPFLVDDNMLYNEDITISLQQSGNTYTLTYSLPRAWLLEEERAYPVVLDPVVQPESGIYTISDQTVFSNKSMSYTWACLGVGKSTVHNNSIARALLKKPKILILDDSTSAVDIKTDALIRQSFKESLPNVTKIIIAQRISSVEDADMIIVLDNGKVSAYGKHDELMKSSEIYKEVYESQKKGAEDE